MTTTTTYYQPRTEFGLSYRTTAYWYAVGYSDGAGTPDLASSFSYYVAARADDYRDELVTSLPSIPDMFAEFIADTERTS